MCGCKRHEDRWAPCTCICDEHHNFAKAKELATNRYDEITRLSAQLQHVSDEVRGLMDSLDDHVTHEDIYEKLHELWKGITV